MLTENYRYVPPKKCVSAGSYIRYIDVKDTKKIRLHKGGFVIEDNGYSIKFTSDLRKIFLFKRFLYKSYNKILKKFNKFETHKS